MKDKLNIKQIQKVLDRYKFVALVLVLGVLLMLLPGTSRATENTQSEPVCESGTMNFDLEGLEDKIEQALSQINGVGTATVVLTLQSSGEDILAQNVTQGTDTQLETVILSSGSSKEAAVTVKHIYPQFQGALVICDGGDNAGVKLEVLKAVSAITGLSSDKISICRRK